MQLLQPKVKELQKKYGHDRQKLAEETMKLYKDAGTNPFASCLPILLQMPIFFALFRLLSQAAKADKPHGFLTKEKAHEFGHAKIFGQLPIDGNFWASRTWGDTPHAGVMIVAAILVLAMTATTFTTQRQLMAKNMPAEAMSGPYAQQQKMLLYILPVAFGSVASRSRSAFSSTGPPPTCGPWASSSTLSATTPRPALPPSRPSRSATRSSD